MPLWDAAKLLDKVGLTVHGEVTRACLLLLGLPERATALLSPHPVEITWKVAAERVAELSSAVFADHHPRGAAHSQPQYQALPRQ